MFKTSKRLVAMLICLAMVLSMLPMAVFAADTITLYCVAPESWTKCNVYAWNDDGNNGAWPGVAMTKGDDGVWYAKVDAKYTKVIFNNGSAQSANLDMPTDENVQFNYGAGTWGTYGTVVEVPEVEYVTVYCSTSWSACYAYWWGSSIDNPEWPGYAMTEVKDGVWSYNVPSDADGLIFDNGNGGGDNQTGNLTVPTTENAMYKVATKEWGVFTTECTHENVTTLEAVAATCISAGKTEGSVCADCGESIVAQEEIPALGHSGDEGEVCANCGETLSYITVYFQNNWEWTDISVHFWGSAIEAGTNWPGKAAELYGNDGTYDIYAIKVPADIGGLIFNGNDAGTGSLNQTPDILDAVDGNCYYMVWDDVNAKNAVGYENIDVILPPACEHEYEYDCSTKCKLCGEETRPEAEHEYFYPCDAYCMHCYELTNPDAAHTINHVDAVAGTDCLTWDGNVEYWTCSSCGGCWLDEALTQQTNRFGIVTNGDHSYFSDCDTVCEICGEETREASHNVIHVEAKAATCYEEGNIEYWYCEACGQAWLDEACTLNTNLKAVILPMAHAEATHVEAKAPTCYEEGNIEYWYCEACGQAWLDEACTLNTNLKAVILPAAHAEATHVEAKAATCTENGNIEYWYCEACGQAWLDEACTLNTNLKSVITPAAHNYVSNVCTVCGEAEYDIVYQTKGGDIRLITYVDDLANYTGVTFTFTVDESDSADVTKGFTSIIAAGKTLTAEDIFGVEDGYLVLYVLTDMAQDYEYDLTVTVTWNGVDGSTASATRVITVSPVTE